MSWKKLDIQLHEYKTELRKYVKLNEVTAEKLATSIASEIRFLPQEQKEKIRLSSPVKLEKRLDELKAFQGFMDITDKSEIGKFPEVVRSQVIYQNYICFHYCPVN